MPTAKRIAGGGRATSCRCRFELGGKSPLLVFDDADLDLAVDLAVEQFDNAGQVCLGGRPDPGAGGDRRRVPRRAFVERAAALVQGDPRDEATDISRLVTRPHFERVDGFVAARHRRRRQARARRRPERRARRPLLPPTILTDAEPGQRDRHRGGLRPGADAADLRRPRTRRSRWPTTPGSAWPPPSSPATRSAPSGSPRSSSPARSGSTASSSATCGAPFGGNGHSGHRPRGRHLVASTSTATSRTRVFAPTAGLDRGEQPWVRWSARACSRTSPRSCCRRRPGGAQRRQGHHPRLRPAPAAQEVFETLDYDTVVVLDSHWATTVEFVVTAQDRRAGLFTSEELPARDVRSVPYDFPGDPELAHAIASRRGRAQHLDHRDRRRPTCRSSTPPPNLWEFLGEGLPDKRWISIGVCQTADTEDYLRLGRALGDAIAAVRPQGAADRVRRAVAHLLAAAPAARPRGQRTSSTSSRPRRCAADLRADRVVQGRATTRRCSTPCREFYRYRPEARFGHYLMMIGALGEERLHRARRASTASTRTRSAPARCTSGSTAPRAASPARAHARTPTTSARRRPRPARRRLTGRETDHDRVPPHPARRQRRRRRTPTATSSSPATAARSASTTPSTCRPVEPSKIIAST